MGKFGSGDPLLLKAIGMAGPRFVASAGWSLITRRPRSLADDCTRLLKRLEPPPKIHGIEHVPAEQPFMLVANHFQAPGLWIGWVAAAITAAVASARKPDLREVHWMLIAEWRGEFAGREMANPLTTAIFPRAAQNWGAIAIPAKATDVGGRARALRQAMEVLGIRGPGEPRNARKARKGDGGPEPRKASKGTEGKERRGEPVAIFPEGQASVGLREAKPGSGAFIHRVNSIGVPLLPVGVHVENGALVVRFGEPFFLPSPPEREWRVESGEKAALDDWARGEVMAAVGRLLPREMWGEYAERVERRE